MNEVDGSVKRLSVVIKLIYVTATRCAGNKLWVIFNTDILYGWGDKLS
jgi:hypothetical protein